VGCRRGYLSGARCRFAHGTADHSLSLAPVNPDSFYLLGTGSNKDAIEKDSKSCGTSHLQREM